MKTSILKAIELILSLDAELLNILSVTAKMSIQSSILALLIGLPIGIWLGACKFPGRNVLLVANRTLMGMPPVVCGLVFYMLFSGVGPFRTNSNLPVRVPRRPSSWKSLWLGVLQGFSSANHWKPG